jgi:alanyl-tRNA synthetase
LREQFGAKGGGSSEMVQGSFEKKHPTMVDAIKALF